MALTSYMISQASDHLSDKQKDLWIFLFRKLQKYKDYALVYTPLLRPVLDDADGTIKARMLNALMKEIDDLEVGEVSVQDREGTRWNQTTERMTLIEEAFDALFDDISTLVIPYSTTIIDGNVYRSTDVAYGNRLSNIGCPICNKPLNFLGEFCGCR